ncbi:MAG: hypothetical protein ABIP06_06530, partial [Pyrinomonadaceae bacterium]
MKTDIVQRAYEALAGLGVHASGSDAAALHRALAALTDSTEAPRLTDAQIAEIARRFEIGSRESDDWGFAWHDFARAI